MNRYPKIQEIIKNEIQMLEKCRNENVVKFRSMLETAKSILMVNDYCDGGDLSSFLEKKKSLDED